MGRLIDADKLIEALENEYMHFSLQDMDKWGQETSTHRSGINCGIVTAINKVKNIPTAYDPDKIVEQLKNKARSGSVMESPGISRTSMFVQINDAIEIVKGGAEWE